MNGLDIIRLILWQSVQIALLVVVTRCLVRMFGDRRPFLSHALWAVVLLKCLTPPIWGSPIGIFSRAAQHAHIEQIYHFATDRFSSPGPRSIESEAAHPRPDDASPGARPGTQITATMALNPIGPAENNGTLIANSQNTPTSWLRPQWIRYLNDLGCWALAIWVTGVLLSSVRLLRRVIGFHVSLRSIPVRPHAAIDAEAKSLSRKLKLRRHVRVDVIDGDIGPAVLGWLQPRILLPARIVDGRSMDRLRPLIAHELIHVRRGDLWWAGLQELAKCLWWFHPLVRHATRALSMEAEKSCDLETISTLRCKPSHYARCLLDVLEQKHRLRSAPTFPGVRAIDITSNRLERIMSTDVCNTPQHRLWTWPLAMVACAIVLPGASLVVAQEQTESPTTENAAVENQQSNDATIAATPQPRVFPNPVSHKDGNEADLSTEDGGKSKDPTSSSDTKDEAWTLRAYEVAKVLERLKRTTGSQKLAEARLMEMMPASRPDSLRRQAEVQLSDGPVKLGGEKPRRVLRDGKLLVFDSPVIQDQIAALLRHGQNYGFAPVMIEASLILVPKERWSDLDIEWNQPGVGAGKAGESNSSASHKNSADVAAIPKLAPAFPIATKTGNATVMPFQRDPDVTGKVLQASAQTVIKETNLMAITILDSDPSRQIAESVSGAQILSRPKVMTMSGRSASVEVGSLKDIVIGYRTDKATNELLPITESVMIGTKMSLRPEVVENRYVNLHVDLSLTRPRESAPGTKEGGEASLASRPLPTTLASSYIKTACSVPLGNTLAIGGIAVEDDGKQYRLLCLLRCSSMDPDAQNSKADPKQPEATENDDARSGRSTLSLIAGKPSNQSGLGMLNFDLLGKEGIRVTIEGEMRATHAAEETVLEAIDLDITWEDGDRIRADQARLRMTAGEPTVAELQGNVRIIKGSTQAELKTAKLVGSKLLDAVIQKMELRRPVPTPESGDTLKKDAD